MLGHETPKGLPLLRFKRLTELCTLKFRLTPSADARIAIYVLNRVVASYNTHNIQSGSIFHCTFLSNDERPVSQLLPVSDHNLNTDLSMENQLRYWKTGSLGTSDKKIHPEKNMKTAATNDMQIEFVHSV